MRAQSPQFYVYLFALQFNRIALIRLRTLCSEPTASVLRDEHLISGLAAGRRDACGGANGRIGRSGRIDHRCSVSAPRPGAAG